MSSTYYSSSLISRLFLKKRPEDKEDTHQEILLRGVLDSLSWTTRVFCLLLSVGYLQLRFPKWNPWADTILTWDHSLQVATAIWVGTTLSRVKHLIFLKYVATKQLGRVALLDQLLDVVIGIIAALHVLETLDIDLGNGLKSLFAAGGVGALAFALAAKDLAENIVGGFLIRAWDAIEPNEKVKLGDGTEGIVTRLGLVDTHIQSFDNLVTRIPNSKIVSQKVVNVSRVKISQVKQTLRFKYSDLDKMPQLLQAVTEEIRATCENVITDGTKPLRAVLTNYEADHIQAEVNCHFRIEPWTAEFVMARQEVIFAIARVVQKNKVEFALPSITYRTIADSAGK